jgi:hypothetical protein
MSACPSREHLALLLAEQLSAAETDVAESHVQICEKCQKTLDHLSGQESPGYGDRTKTEDRGRSYPLRKEFLHGLREILPDTIEARNHNGGAEEFHGAGVQGNWPQVPAYELLGLLGKGGMGVVYKARQRGLKRLVALKMIKSDEANETDLTHLFAPQGRLSGGPPSLRQGGGASQHGRPGPAQRQAFSPRRQGTARRCPALAGRPGR